MNTLFINGKECEYTDEINILEVARKAGVEIPTFCYRPDLKPFGACRMCVVEVEYPNGRVIINSSCTMPPEPGIKVKTNTERVRRIRKTVLELLLSNHDRECTLCDKSGYCELQKYSEEYGIKKLKYAQKRDYKDKDESSFALVRDPNKCILCGACVQACSQHQGLQVLGFSGRGSKTRVQPMAGMDLAKSECIFCGQCAAVCPTGAITIKSEIEKVQDAIYNPNMKVVAQFAPSVRVALGEMFGLEPGENTAKLINAALKAIGFDLVFDTNFSADLTIVEEATEFVQRVTQNGVLPMFTSCCPGWVRFVENEHPEMIPHLSTCRSPQGMMGAIIRNVIPKTYEGYTADNIYSVSIMPCTAKKAEIAREQFKLENGKSEIDCVLTTQELGRLIKASGIDFKKLEPQEPDSPFKDFTGAGTIFGVSGGVAEAAVRTAYEYVTGEPINNLEIKEMRGLDRVKTIELDLKGTPVKVKIVNTLKEAEKCIQEIKAGKADYQMLEVMACPGGCINGGGQPQSCKDSTIKEKRAEGLYQDDRNLPIRRSHENPDIKKLYADFLEKPGSHEAHHLLHTSYDNKKEKSYKYNV